MEEPELLTYDIGKGARAFSTGRRGGYGKGAYASFNVDAHCGDDERDVRLNRDLLCRALGLETSRLIMPRQVHGTCVRRIDEAFFLLSDAARAALLEGVDAVTTDLPGVCVSVSTADCIPILLYDGAHHAVGAVHAGWRGTAARIAQATLQAMADVYGTRPADVEAALGPGISLEAFEVGEEVYDAFRAAGFPMGEVARRYPGGGRTGKWHIDLWQANRDVLEGCGMSPGRIRVAGVCTYGNPGRFFSARRLGIRSGRILNGIFLTTDKSL